MISHRRKRILLVDDTPDNQKLVSYLLMKMEVELTFANNGERGLEIAIKAMETGKAFDIILMDLQMPVMDGYESTKRMRAEGIEAKIYAFTAFASTQSNAYYQSKGFTGLLSKPITREVFCTTIERVPLLERV